MRSRARKSCGDIRTGRPSRKQAEEKNLENGGLYDGIFFSRILYGKLLPGAIGRLGPPVRRRAPTACRGLPGQFNGCQRDIFSILPETATRACPVLLCIAFSPGQSSRPPPNNTAGKRNHRQKLFRQRYNPPRPPSSNTWMRWNHW